METPETQTEDTLLYYPDDKENIGPGEFVMHGVNLFFRRGAITGPVTTAVAGIVTSREKQPVIRIATEDDKKRAAAPAPDAGAKSEQQTTTVQQNTATTSSDPVKSDDAPPVAKTDDTTKTEQSNGTGTTAPGDPAPGVTAETQRRQKQGTKLTTG